jgi:hypothetical protein
LVDDAGRLGRTEQSVATFLIRAGSVEHGLDKLHCGSSAERVTSKCYSPRLMDIELLRKHREISVLLVALRNVAECSALIDLEESIMH